MTVLVSPSAVQELFVALSNLSVPGDDYPTLPWARRIAEGQPQLLAAVRALWPDGAALTRTGMELLVLAGAFGYISDPVPDRLLADLPGLPEHLLRTTGLNQPPGDLPNMEVLLADRFRELADPARMAHYSQIAAAVWEAIRPEWEAEGAVRAEGEAELFRRRLAEAGAIWVGLLPTGHPARLEYFYQQMTLLGDVMVMPSYFGRGMHFIYSRGRLYAGYALQVSGHREAAMQRTRALALRMKAFSDPTRLALLVYITKIGMSVTDLATLFGISQPTVSEHLRILREAGVVQFRRAGTRTYYFAVTPAVDELLTEVRTLVTRPG